jgi:hypothetical protein
MTCFGFCSIILQQSIDLTLFANDNGRDYHDFEICSYSRVNEAQKSLKLLNLQEQL